VLCSTRLRAAWWGAQQISVSSLIVGLRRMRAGLSDREVAGWIEGEMRRKGCSMAGLCGRYPIRTEPDGQLRSAISRLWRE